MNSRLDRAREAVRGWMVSQRQQGLQRTRRLGLGLRMLLEGNTLANAVAVSLGAFCIVGVVVGARVVGTDVGDGMGWQTVDDPSSGM